MDLIWRVTCWETGPVGDDPGVALAPRAAGHEVARLRVKNAGYRAVSRALVEVVELVDDGIDCL